MLKPLIRPATADDLSGVLALYRQLNPDDPALDVAGAAPTWAAVLGSGLTTPFVAEIDGRLVSSCTLAIVPNLSRGARPYAVIENVVTDEGHRRSGLGRAVLEARLRTIARGSPWSVQSGVYVRTTINSSVLLKARAVWAFQQRWLQRRLALGTSPPGFAPVKGRSAQSPLRGPPRAARDGLRASA